MKLRHSAEITVLVRRRSTTHWLVGFLLAIVAALAAGAAHVRAQQLQAGTNVNVGGGPACTNDQSNPFYNPGPDGIKGNADDPFCPAKVFGDLTAQRQNEGSMDCSSRNNASCLAAGNDYRLIGAAGDNDGKVTSDAWMGIYWTRDGGMTWRSSLLPGWGANSSFADDSADGLASPLRTFEAAADATVRAGTNGLFYVSGIAFNRAGETNGAGVVGKVGVHFVSTYLDDNTTSDPNQPPRHLRTVVVDSGTNGQFLDKPWIAVDVPRGGAACGNVYVAYSTFLGSGNNPHTDIWLKSSSDCGVTWSNGTKLTASIPVGQSAILQVAKNGDLWAAWREFGLNGNSDKIWASKSTNAGKSFSRAAVVADLGVPTSQSVSAVFDAPSLPNADPLNDSLRSARSHGFPALCVGSDNIARLAFAQRNASGWARIVMTTSSDAKTWAPLQAIDNHGGPGHQFQPTLACAGTQATAAWYDQKNDIWFAVSQVFSTFIIDVLNITSGAWAPVHTIDVRAAQKTGVDPNVPFDPSIQVSRYPIVFNGTDFVQTKYNFLNLPLFSKGRIPFIGDYIEIIAKNKFTPPIGSSGWSFNDYVNETPVLSVIWADNRDVLETSSSASVPDVASSDFTNFEAPKPDTAACTPDNVLRWTRNQNLYTALLNRGLIVQVDGNARRTKELEKRAYVLSVFNLVKPDPGTGGYGTGDEISHKRFKLSLTGGAASFGFGSVPDLRELLVDIRSFSGVARTVFVPKNSTNVVIVQVEEVDAGGTAIPGGLKGRAIIAPDPNAPVQPLADEDHAVSLEPVLFKDGTTTYTTFNYTPGALTSGAVSSILGNESLFNSINLGDINLGDINLGDINLGDINLGDINLGDINLGDINLGDINLGDINLGDINLGDINLGDINLGDINLGDINLGDTPIATTTSLTVTNNGNVSSGYDLTALLNQVQAGSVMQLVVGRLLTVPVVKDCKLVEKVILQPLASAASTTGGTAASFSLPPGGVATILLQVACDGTDKGSNPVCFNPEQDLTVSVTPQAPYCDTTQCLVNDAPAGTDGSVALNEDTPYTFAVANFGFTDPNDAPPNALASVKISSLPATGTLTVNSGPVSAGQHVSAADIAAGALKFSPAPDGNGVPYATFTFQVRDDGGAVAGGVDLDPTPNTLTINVTPVNDNPVAIGDAAVVAEDSGATVVAVLANDNSGPDTGETLAVTAVTQGANGGVTFTPTGVSYTPAANYNGPDSFTYTIGDGNGGSAIATVDVTVTPVNDNPVANGDAATVVEDSGANVIAVLANDNSGPDAGETLAVTAVTQGANGGVTFTPTGVSYTPAANYSGLDSFTYTIGDGNGGSATATVNVTVTNVNDAPVANPDAAAVVAGGTVAISVLANDTDVDNAASTLVVNAITISPAHGTAVISADGKTINYTAQAYIGTDTFQYTARDPSGALSSPALVTITDTALGFKGLLSPYKAPPQSYNLGSSAPLVWQYADSAGQVIDSAFVQSVLYVTFTKTTSTAANCSDGSDTTTVLINKDFPGNSNYQYFTTANPHSTAGANTWQFNWQLTTPVTAGCWKVHVILDFNGNGNPATGAGVGDAGDQVNGPYPIKVR